MAALNCTAAAVAGVVTFGSAAAAPVTGGASLALTTVGYAATAATAIGCANSLARTYNALWSPATNSRWDDFPAYKTTMQVVDGVSLLGVGASAVAATRAVKVLRNAGVSIPSAISGNINRQQAALLTKEMIRLRRPNVSNGELKKLVKQGVEPKRYPAPQISAGALKSLKDSVAAGLSFLSVLLMETSRKYRFPSWGWVHEIQSLSQGKQICLVALHHHNCDGFFIKPCCCVESFVARFSLVPFGRNAYQWRLFD